MGCPQSALVVDDDEVVRTAVVTQLKKLGVLRVDTSGDGVDAANQLRRGMAYDLIVSDLALPGMDGVEFLRDAGRSQPKAALVLMSALDERVLRSVAVLSRERGLRVVGALRKPVRVEALQELIAGLSASQASGTTVSPQAGAGQIARALERGDVALHVQPKLRAADNTLHSVECLARWTDPRLGAVSPLALARAAERGGLTASLTEYVLNLALSTCAGWAKGGLEVPVAVNLTGMSLRRLDLPDLIERQLQAYKLAPAMLIVEVGEEALADDTAVLDVLSRLRMRDVRVAMDHFGTSAGSLLRLQRLPVTELKIDRGFIRHLPGGLVARTVIEFSIKLAKALGLESVAVGVETAEQAQILRDLGCDILQGRYLADVMEPSALPGWKPGQNPPVGKAA